MSAFPSRSSHPLQIRRQENRTLLCEITKNVLILVENLVFMWDPISDSDKAIKKKVLRVLFTYILSFACGKSNFIPLSFT